MCIPDRRSIPFAVLSLFALSAQLAAGDFPAASEGHVPGDVVTAEGDVDISDSGHHVIWRVRGGVLEKLATDPGLRSLQGQALGPRLDRLIELARNTEGADEPTLITSVSPSALVYIANSQWEKYDKRGLRRPGTKLGPTLGFLISMGIECGTPDPPPVR